MILNYCTDCGAKLVSRTDVRYTCQNGHHYYNNARSAVALLFAKDGQVLFAKRKNEPSKGKYDFPGGFVDLDESLEDAVKREAQEELGITINAFRYVASAPNPYENDTHVCDTLFLVTDWSGTMTADDDVAAIEWKDVEFISSKEFACPEYHRALPQIRKAIKGL